MRVTTCFVLICSLLLYACAAQNATASKPKDKEGKRQIACGNKHLAANKPHLDWVIESKTNVATTGMPEEFELYSIDGKQLNEFFVAASEMNNEGAGLKTLLPLPQPVGCVVANVISSETMSPELKKKYPQIVSLKGSCVMDTPCDVRMDYNGKVMNVQVIINAKVYVISPIASGNETYYMVYAKEDVGLEKEPFETTK